MPPALTPLIARIWAAGEASGLVARTVTVKVKYADFQQITRARSVADGVTGQAMLQELGFELLRPLFPPPFGVRLLGITLLEFCRSGRSGNANWR